MVLRFCLYNPGGTVSVAIGRTVLEELSIERLSAELDMDGVQVSTDCLVVKSPCASFR